MKKNSIGTWICSYNMINLEILTNSEFEWFTIDLEHSAMSLDQCFSIVSFVKSSSKKSCFVRMSDLNQSNIKRALDFGVDGIILPMVKDENDIKKIIDAAHYPPVGSRGTGLFRAQVHGDNFETYIKNSYKNTKIIIQIEHIDAINNLEILLKDKRSQMSKAQAGKRNFTLDRLLAVWAISYADNLIAEWVADQP